MGSGGGGPMRRGGEVFLAWLAVISQEGGDTEQQSTQKLGNSTFEHQRKNKESCVVSKCYWWDKLNWKFPFSDFLEGIIGNFAFSQRPPFWPGRPISWPEAPSSPLSLEMKRQPCESFPDQTILLNLNSDCDTLMWRICLRLMRTWTGTMSLSMAARITK